MKRVAVVTGIRPDFIRTSEVLKLLHKHKDVALTLIHTGQHYDENLSDIFFKELEIPGVDIMLDTKGSTPCEQHSKLIAQLANALEVINPHVCLFLGDANAVIGAIAPYKMGIPIAHIEAGMRSYDMTMPEERNRRLIDNISDVLYVYQEDYRVQLIQEGISPDKIVVTGNVIVDVLNRYTKYSDWPNFGMPLPQPIIFGGTKLLPREYALMTLHRNEHMNREVAYKIIDGVNAAMKDSLCDIPVMLIEMPRLKSLNIKYPTRFHPIKPLGFFDFLTLEANAAIEFTDSGTNQETASLLGTPCVVTRTCTERPECRDCGTTVLSGHKLDDIVNASKMVLARNYNIGFTLGDGRASQRIVDDLMYRLSVNFNVVSFKNKHFRLL